VSAGLSSRCHQGREATPSIHALPFRGEGYSMRGAPTTQVNGRTINIENL
jgi:hypothetical protein